MVLMHDVGAVPCPGGIQPPLADALGDIAAAVVYLEKLSERIQMGVLPGERDPATIPPNTLIAVRRNCQCVSRHAERALASMNPRRAQTVRNAADHVREVETLRYADGKSR